MHAIGMPFIPTLAVLPSHHRIMLELVEPGADEAVAALDLVVEERERQCAVHRLDPEGQAAQFHREGIKIHTIDAALDDMTPEDRLEAGLK